MNYLIDRLLEYKHKALESRYKAKDNKVIAIIMSLPFIACVLGFISFYVTNEKPTVYNVASHYVIFLAGFASMMTILECRHSYFKHKQDEKDYNQLVDRAIRDHSSIDDSELYSE